MPAKLTKSQQAAVDKTIAEGIAEARAQLVQAAAKPELVDNLRATWRKSAEHKAAQVKRFVAALVGVVVVQIIADVSAGKNPLDHFTDAKTAWYYLLPFALVAWRQVHPSMTASQVDSAPGATIVPTQVAAPGDATDPAPEGDAAP